MKRLFLAGALAAAAVCLSPGAASAQTGTARGKVVDDKGQGLEGAQITLEYQGPMTRKFETKTNKKGEFTQVGMQPGVYRVTANKEGYVGTFVEARIIQQRRPECCAVRQLEIGCRDGERRH